MRLLRSLVLFGGQMANARAQSGFVEKSKPDVCVCC